jgi:hypothetical protein
MSKYMKVWETQHRIWSEQLIRLCGNENEEIARVAAASWVLLYQHKVNNHGQCRLCFRPRPIWWPRRRPMCTVHIAFMVAMKQPLDIVRGWVRSF